MILIPGPSYMSPVRTLNNCHRALHWDGPGIGGPGEHHWPADLLSFLKGSSVQALKLWPIGLGCYARHALGITQGETYLGPALKLSSSQA